MTEIDASPAREARLLLRAARAGTLATGADGQPFASLVTPATAPDASVLLLLSDLSEHTRHLRAEPRCALLVAGAAEGPNAQTAPRVTLTGLAAIETDPALRERWVALHPYAAFYAGFGDFNVWRIRPLGALFVGGFARAHRLRHNDLVCGVLGGSKGLVAEWNAGPDPALGLIATAHGLAGDGWRVAACDADGLDLVLGEAVRRIAWPAPVQDAGAARNALAHLADAARKRTITAAGRVAPGGL